MSVTTVYMYMYVHLVHMYTLHLFGLLVFRDVVFFHQHNVTKEQKTTTTVNNIVKKSKRKVPRVGR